MADDRGPGLQAVLVVCLALCVISTSLRFYSMGVILKRFYTEDWLAGITLILYIAYTVTALLGVKYGIGKHLEDVPLQDRVTAMMWRWIGTYLYIAVSALVKVVIGLFLLRICSHSRWERITLWALMGIVVVYNIFYFFIAIFACRPVEYQWTGYDPATPEGRCNSALFATVPTYIAAFLNVLADWILPLLPARLVWKASMERRKKISICAVMSIGTVASIASIVRCPYAYTIIDNPEYLYTFEPLAAWSTIEIGLGLTASSLATLTPLFRKIRIFNGATRTSGADGVNSQYQERRVRAALPSHFPDREGGLEKGVTTVEALKRRPSDEIELYRFGP